MKASGRAAANQMRVWCLEGKQGVKGWCLRFCRTAWGLPGDEASAIAEWNSIPVGYRKTDSTKAPIGAPHFWAVGEHGHVALQSGKAGWVWSTDAPVADKIGLVPVSWFEKYWGAKYLGWSTQFQNQMLPLKEMPNVHKPS